MCSQTDSQDPLNPVWPVMRTRRPRQKSGFTGDSCSIASVWPTAVTTVSVEDGFAAKESLGVGTRRVALHAAQPEQAREHVLAEPALRALGAEVAHQVVDLALTEVLGQRHEGV